MGDFCSKCGEDISQVKPYTEDLAPPVKPVTSKSSKLPVPRYGTLRFIAEVFAFIGWATIKAHGHSKTLLKELTSLEHQEEDLRSALDKYNDTAPTIYTSPQLRDIAAEITAELNSDDINKKRAALRGIVQRVIAKRTDDQILGLMYCNQVNGHVPPRGSEPNNLLYPISIKIRSHKTPLVR